jgi:histidyl-tRNA synthetase
VRTVLAFAGLNPAEQLAAYDRLLEGDQAVTSELAAQHPEGAPALRLLFDIDGTAAGYLANVRAALLSVVPEAEAPLAELEAAAAALDAAGCMYRFVPGTARNFEYYTGLTFRLLAGDVECVRGGRYDGLSEAIRGRAIPASGFGADLLKLADVVNGGAQ